MQCLSVLVGIYDERWYKEALLSSTNAVIFSQLLCNSNDLNSANRKWGHIHRSVDKSHYFFILKP